MCDPINTLAELINCLQDSVQGATPPPCTPPGTEFISFGAELFPAAGQLVAYLDPSAASLLVEQQDCRQMVQPDPANNLVNVLGKATLFKGIDYEIVITGRVPSPGVVNLDMKATPLSTQWSFASNFAEFPPYLGYNYDAPPFGIDSLPSFLNDIVVTSPAFRVFTYEDPAKKYPLGLSFEGVFDAQSGPLGAHLGVYLPGGNSLPLLGSVQARGNDTFPLLTLVASIPDLTVAPLGTVVLTMQTADAEGDDPAASSITFDGSVVVGDFPPLLLSGPALQGDFAWSVEIAVEDPQKFTLKNGLQELASFVGGHPLMLPSGLDPLASFYLSSVTVGLNPAAGGLTINVLGVTVRTEQQWTPPLPGISVGDIEIQWLIINPLSASPLLDGQLTGAIFFGPADDSPRLDVEVGLTGIGTDSAPAFTITATLDPDFPVNVDDLIEHFVGVDVGLGLQVSVLDLEADTGARTLLFFAMLESDVDIFGIFEFTSLTFAFEYTPNSLNLSLGANVTIAALPFEFSALYRGEDAGWLFDGYLLPDDGEVTLNEFVNALADNRWPDMPDSVGSIALRGLSGSFDTLTKDFAFGITVGWHYVLDPGVLEWDIEAEFSIESHHPTPQSPATYSGFVSGQIQVNALSVTVLYSFAVGNNKTVTFQLTFNTLTLTCVVSQNEEHDWILSANLSGVTFGGMLEYLVNLVDPSLGFTLSAPWDVLNEINFSNLTLVVNLTTKTVGFTYAFPNALDLGIVRLDSVGLAYVNKAGKTTVDISITGRFFDQTYDATDPLAWDLLNDPPPTPPGQGSQLLDVRYLGVGQNVGFRDTTDFTTVADVMASLEAEFTPPADPNQNPLLSLSNLKFTGDNHWLIGADFTVMGAVSLMVVFSDPALYGLRVGLSGAKAGTLSGLEFEILYKKVTDAVGVYHIALKLPDAMRQFQLGAASITLPVVTIDIFTNGNFRIDFGFPANRDFTNSFCVQVFPFIGYGGFYFALLNGSTSDIVPQITNGTFSPVIELGLGLSVGLGKTINQGPIQAGFTLTLEAMVEGVLAWFNPNDRSSASAVFFRIQGTAALVGKLYGIIDFVVVKAELKVTAYASVTLVIESFQPILVRMEVGVEVSVSLKILFITVHFSFSTTLDMSFTIGSASATPWTLGTPDPLTTQLELRQQRTHYPRPRLSASTLQRMIWKAADVEIPTDWTVVNVFGGQVEDVPLLLLPSFTVASEDTLLSFVGKTLPGGTSDAPSVQTVMALFAPNSIDPAARRGRDLLKATPDDPESATFNLLVWGMLAWAVEQLPPTDGEGVTAGGLQELSDFLADDGNRQAIFTYERLTQFIEENFRLLISAPVGGATAPVSASIFPMIPALAMSPSDNPTIEFWNYACASEQYRDFLSSYFSQLQVDVLANVADDPLAGATGPTGLTGPTGPIAAPPDNPTGAGAPSVGCTGGAESLATIIFCDYFAMLTKSGVQNAIDLLKAYPYEATGQESLETIADEFGTLLLEYETRPGDSPATVAARFGLRTSALRAQNEWLAGYGHDEKLPPGSRLLFGLTATENIAQANADYPLQGPTGVQMPIAGVKHQVKSGETLAGIGDAYGIPDVGSIFTFVPTDVTANPNAGNQSLLQPGATMNVPPFTYTVVEGDMLGGDPLTRIASLFFVRNLGGITAEFYRGATGPDFSPFVGWYAQSIVAPTAGPWTVPVAGATGGSIIQTGTTPYDAKHGDTVELVAGYFLLSQLDPGEPRFQNFLGSIVAPPAIAPGATLGIPSLQHVVQQGDSFQSIADTFQAAATPSVGVGALALANAAQPQLIQPLAVLALPTFNYTTNSGDTLATVAQAFDLTLEELADSVAETAGIFMPFADSGERMVIPDVPSRDLESLRRDLVAFGKFNTTAGMVSRFLMHGLRVPDPGGPLIPRPDAGDGPRSPFGTDLPPLFGLYEMIGQQFAAPQNAAGGFAVTFTKGLTAEWICFQSATGATGPTGCAAQLVVQIGPSFMAENFPSTTFAPEILYGPTALPLYQDDPVRYSIQESLHWQAATDIQLGPTGLVGATGATAQAGQPSIWVFPDTLNEVIGTSLTGPSASTPPYELVAASALDPTGERDSALKFYSWATAIALTVQRIPSETAGGFMPNSYLMVGADEGGRDLLRLAWTYLQSADSNGASIYLLYPPSLTSGNAKGLASDSLDSFNTFLLKTNLSTVTTSNLPPFLLRFGPPGGGEQFFARFDTPGDFLEYLWQASITGRGGFYLNYVNQNGGQGLPVELFANGDETTVWLVMLLDSQSLGSHPDRGLYAFNNCAVLAENLDPTANAIFARATRPTASDLRRAATVPPGNVGFYLARTNPDPGASGQPGPTGPEDLTRTLYNLVGYRLLPNDFFTDSPEGLPVGPVSPTQKDAQPLPGIPFGPTDPNVWQFEGVVPVWKYGKVNDAPPSPTGVTYTAGPYPPPGSNPYTGITGPTFISDNLSKAQLTLEFHDIYGNRTLSTEPLLPLDVTVGYTDTLVGVSSWPGAAYHYLFDGGATGGVELDTSLSLQLTKYVPGGSLDYASAVYAASSDAERYKQIFYQVQQNDLAFELNTNLGQVLIAPDQLKAALSGFITKAKVFTDAAASLGERTYKTLGTEQFGQVAADFSVTPGALGLANQDVTAASLFDGAVVVPNIKLAAPMNTLEKLVAGQASTPFPPTCAGIPFVSTNDASPRVHGLRVLSSDERERAWELSHEFRGATGPILDDLSPVELAEHNLSGPLSPGIVLRTETRRTTLPDPLGPVVNSLAGVAASLNCVVYAEVVDPDSTIAAKIPIGLFADNYQQPGIITPGLNIIVGEVAVTTDDGSTFESLYNSFNAIVPMTVGDFAAAIEDVTGIFRTRAELSFADFIVPAPADPGAPTFSIADLPPEAGTVAQLATLNRVVENFYNAGTPLYFNFTCVAPAPTDTLADVASGASVPVEQLALYNALTKLKAGVSLLIPNLTFIRDDVDLYAPYEPTAQNDLAAIAALFSPQSGTPTTTLDIANLNRFLPGIFAEGVQITLGGTVVSPAAQDSLQSVFEQFVAVTPEFSQFVAAIENIAGLFRTNGVVIAPPPYVPDDGTGASPTLGDVAGGFNIRWTDAGADTLPAAARGVVPLFEANRSLDGFLLAGATFFAPPPGATGSIGVRAHDTIDTLIGRFDDEQGITATVEGLAASNFDRAGLLSVGQKFLLPPNSTDVRSPVSAAIPPAGATGEAAVIFPVAVGVRMTRQPSLVAPDFLGVESVARSDSRLAPRISVADGLAVFAAAFEDAFKSFRLKCAVSRQEAVGDGEEEASIWAVNFGEQGISRFNVLQSEPQFYALKPLATSLQTQTVDVSEYRSGCGLCQPAPTRFESIDLDSWMQQFLATVDLFLSPAYSVPAFQNVPGLTGPLFFAAPGFATSPLPTSGHLEGPRGFVDAGGYETTHGRPGRLARPSGVFGLTGVTGANGCEGCTGMTAPFGPSDYNQIVAAKEAIAAGLKQNVTNVLDYPGATGDFYVEVAQEALYQQMLVSLSSAYTVEAIIQYPVDVQTPFITPPPGATGVYPPRASGKVVPDSYVIPSLTIPINPPPDSIAAVALHYEVSSAFFAFAVQNMRGVLRAGAVVTHPPSDPFTVTAESTLADVAAHFIGATPTWEEWTAFVSSDGPQPGIESQGIFGQRASFSATKIAREVFAPDTLDSLADYMNIDVSSFARANQDVQDIFIGGTVIQMPGFAPYTVAPGDTMLKIVNALNSQPPPPPQPATVDSLAQNLHDVSPLLSVGQQLHFIQVLPEVTLSTSKVSLGVVGSPGGPDPALSFLLNVKHESAQKKLFLNLKYVINEIEYAVADVSGVEGYQESSWLTLVLPIGGGQGADVSVQSSMEQVQIPLPLRSYPTPPTLVSQSGIATAPGATAIAEAKQWDYRFDYLTDTVAQDTSYLEVLFNLQEQSGGLGFFAGPGPTLFAALAEFITAYPQLSKDLALLTTVMPGQYNHVAAVAVQVLATFATNVAAAFNSGPGIVPEFLGSQWPTQVYDYKVKTTSDDVHLRNLFLIYEPGPSGPTSPVWPGVLVQSPTAPTAGTGPDAGFLNLTFEGATGFTATYLYPPDQIPADSSVRQRLHFAGRDVIQNKNAWGGVKLVRNEDLITSGPLGATAMVDPISTNPEFIYQTPLVRFVERLVPMVFNQQAIDVSGLTGPTGGPPSEPRTLIQHLLNMLDAALDLDAPLPIQSFLEVLCSFGFNVADPASVEGILIAQTPLRLSPIQSIDPASELAFAQQLCESITNWRNTSGPVGAEGFLIFDLRVFAQSQASGATGQPAAFSPILELAQLRLPLDKIIFTC